VQPGHIDISTALFWQLMSLFAYEHSVGIDRAQRYVVLATRRFWFWTTTRVVRFSEIQCLEYGYFGIANEWFISPSYSRPTDEIDHFSVGIRLKNDGEVLPLCSHTGEGSIHTGLVGVLLGDDLIDVAGTQEEESHDLVRLLSRFMGLSIGNVRPEYQPGTRGPAGICAKCARSSALLRGACVYCGGELKPVALDDDT
jgi:hypothetical protein